MSPLIQRLFGCLLSITLRNLVVAYTGVTISAGVPQLIDRPLLEHPETVAVTARVVVQRALGIAVATAITTVDLRAQQSRDRTVGGRLAAGQRGDTCSGNGRVVHQ